MAALVLSVYFIEERAHSTNSTMSEVLVPKNTLFSIPPTQFNSISINITTNSVINGTFYSNYGVDLYVLTPSAFHTLTVDGKVPSSEWSSGGLVGNASTVFLNLDVPTGAWVLVYLNPSRIVTSYVGFYTDLTLSSG